MARELYELGNTKMYNTDVADSFYDLNPDAPMGTAALYNKDGKTYVAIKYSGRGNWAPGDDDDYTTHKITFLVDSSVYDTQIVFDNQLPSPPTTPTMPGYSFVQWEIDGSKYDFSEPLTEDITVEANFKRQCVVTFNYLEKEYAKEIVNFGGTCPTVGTPAPIGKYIVSNWKLDGTDYDFSSEVTDNITLYVETTDICTVRFVVDGSEFYTTEVLAGGTVTPPVAPNVDGFVFSNWKLGEETFSGATVIVKSVTVFGVYTPVSAAFYDNVINIENNIGVDKKPLSDYLDKTYKLTVDGVESATMRFVSAPHIAESWGADMAYAIGGADGFVFAILVPHISDEICIEGGLPLESNIVLSSNVDGKFHFIVEEVETPPSEYEYDRTLAFTADSEHSMNAEDLEVITPVIPLTGTHKVTVYVGNYTYTATGEWVDISEGGITAYQLADGYERVSFIYVPDGYDEAGQMLYATIAVSAGDEGGLVSGDYRVTIEAVETPPSEYEYDRELEFVETSESWLMGFDSEAIETPIDTTGYHKLTIDVGEDEYSGIGQFVEDSGDYQLAYEGSGYDIRFHYMPDGITQEGVTYYAGAEISVEGLSAGTYRVTLEAVETPPSSDILNEELDFALDAREADYVASSFTNIADDLNVTGNYSIDIEGLSLSEGSVFGATTIEDLSEEYSEYGFDKCYLLSKEVVGGSSPVLMYAFKPGIPAEIAQEMGYEAGAYVVVNIPNTSTYVFEEGKHKVVVKAIETPPSEDILNEDLTFAINDNVHHYIAGTEANIVDDISLDGNYAIEIEGLSLIEGRTFTDVTVGDATEDYSEMGFTNVTAMISNVVGGGEETNGYSVFMFEPSITGEVATMFGVPEGTNTIVMVSTNNDIIFSAGSHNVTVKEAEE